MMNKKKGEGSFKILIDRKVCEASSGEELQEISERSNADILFGCFSGRCGACRVRVVAGAENLNAMDELEVDLLSQIEASPDERLACQCQVSGFVSIESHR